MKYKLGYIIVFCIWAALYRSDLPMSNEKYVILQLPSELKYKLLYCLLSLLHNVHVDTKLF